MNYVIRSTPKLEPMKPFLFSIFWFIVSPAFSQDPIAHFCKTINPEELRTCVEKLASPDFEGRAFNTNGEKKAANYLSGEFNMLNLKFFPSNFIDLSLPFDSILHFAISNEKTTLNNMVDFGNACWFFWSNGQKMPVVYAGFGIDHPNYSDYSGIDAKGKFVAVSEGQPINSSGINLVTGGIL